MNATITKITEASKMQNSGRNLTNKPKGTLIMSTNSKCMMLLCLALPLTLSAGYASDANKPAATGNFNAVPAPIVAPVSARMAADKVVNNEIFNVFLTEKTLNNGTSASVVNGVVTLNDPMSDKSERQALANQISGLAGVEQVNDQSGVELASVTTSKAVAVR